ncbi:hypothetical protein BH23BAC2_BH23BAC2_03930 [soil metagenome]
MKNLSTELKWGVLFIIAGLAWVWIEKLFGLHDVYVAQHPIYTNLFGIIAVTIFIFALREKRRDFFVGVMTWREGFTSGIIMTLVITLLSPLAQYITYEYISPEYFNNITEHTVQAGAMSREDAEAYFSLRSYLIQATFGALVMGIVTSAIVAWFVKTAPAKEA